MKNRGTVVSIAQAKPPVNEKLLSVREAAEQLGVSASFVYSSDIPYAKIGRRKLFLPSDLALYVRARLSHRIDTEAE